MLVFAEHAWRQSAWFKSVLMLILGIFALVISGSAVLQRVSASNEAKLAAARSGNLPRVQAEQALTEAKEALATASAAAQAECATGRKRLCLGQEAREHAARERVVEARAKLVGLGGMVAEDPGAQVIAAILPISAEDYQHIAPALLPIWLELTAPLLLAFGLAPSRRRKDEAVLATAPATADNDRQATAAATVKRRRKATAKPGRDPERRRSSQAAYRARKAASGQHLRIV